MSATSVSATGFLTREDPAYDEHVATFNLATTHRPAYDVAARTAYDVATAVRFASTAPPLMSAPSATPSGAAYLPVTGRTFGFSADRVCRMTVVTADGESRGVTPDREPDLFWGLRGGKGNLGIVTSLTVGLAPFAAIYGGGGDGGPLPHQPPHDPPTGGFARPLHLRGLPGSR